MGEVPGYLSRAERAVGDAVFRGGLAVGAGQAGSGGFCQRYDAGFAEEGGSEEVDLVTLGEWVSSLYSTTITSPGVIDQRIVQLALQRGPLALQHVCEVSAVIQPQQQLLEMLPRRLPIAPSLPSRDRLSCATETLILPNPLSSPPAAL